MKNIQIEDKIVRKLNACSRVAKETDATKDIIDDINYAYELVQYIPHYNNEQIQRYKGFIRTIEGRLGLC